MSTLPINSRINEYKITGHLGSGGFAHTYLALDTNLNKTVAIKEFFPARLCQRDENYWVCAVPGAEVRFERYREAFIEEARILARFDHPNIVKVLRFISGLGTAFIIMEHVDGQPMSGYFAYDRVLGEDRVRRWLTGILGGLEVVHDAGIIHGDIKPKNILITADDQAVLIDFGASVIYKSALENDLPIAELHISRNYAAPEQTTLGARLDHRLDLFALGAVFFEAITGDKPPAAGAAAASAEILRYRRFYNQRLLASIQKAMSADPADRYATAQVWAEEISLTFTERTWRALKRNAAAIAAVLLLAAGIAWSVHYVVDNSIDTKNYHWKLFASQEEVLARFRLSDGYLKKLAEAEAFLAVYSADYGAQAEKIGAGDLITGLNSPEGLADYRGAVVQVQSALARARAEIERLTDLYYFDDLARPLTEVNGAIETFGARQGEFNTRLLAAYVESEIVARARVERIEIDRAQLAEEIGVLRSGTELEDLAALVPQGLPLVVDFLDRQRRAAEIREFEASRMAAIETIRDISESFRDNSRFRDFAPLEGQAREAARERQLELAVSAAEELARAIRSEQQAAAKRRTEQQRASERRSLVNALDASMISVPAGSFVMGSNRHGYAIPPRPVEVHAFFLQRHEVTNAQWEECRRDNACPEAKGAGGGAGFPVTGVTWDGAQAFVAWVNQTSTRFRYRLPSEAEWEYVAKTYGFVLREIEDPLDEAGKQGTNKLGVASIVGNALEWLEDCWHGGYVGAPSDSRAWVRGFECQRRIVRGANWEGLYSLTPDNVTYFRPAGLERSEIRKTLGFRLAAERR